MKRKYILPEIIIMNLFTDDIMNGAPHLPQWKSGMIQLAKGNGGLFIEEDEDEWIDDNQNDMCGW
ncbi:MAG: hypothetical protein IKQ68_03950 [Prevotella sp.]|nr:hypothetical protein [Prevotella sp.]